MSKSRASRARKGVGNMTDQEKLGRIYQMVDDLHKMHTTGGGCGPVKLATNSIVWLRGIMIFLTSAVCGWLGFIHLSLAEVRDIVFGLKKMMQ